jgi:hypothetical protein
LAHVEDDLAGLLSGDLSRDAVSVIVGHLHGCDVCRQALVVQAAASGVLQLSARALPRAEGTSTLQPPAPESDLPPLRRPARVRGPRLLAAAAALAVLAGSGGLALATRDSTSPSLQPPPSVALTSPIGTDARGVVTLPRAGQRADLTVSTVSLSAPPAGQFYEVWLFDPATSKMVGVGVLATDGRGTFRIPATLVTSYRAVDVSLQRDNGDPRHSATSVLRGRYS